jgi:hypothetical protein
MVTGQSTEVVQDCNQIMERDGVLYSYGRHFELARPLRTKRGKIHGYLLNGDTYSQSTSQHQAHVRYLLRDESTVIIPYEALNSAGIDLDTVQIIHVKPDTTTTTKHCTTEFPKGAFYRQEPEWEYVRPTDADYAEAVLKAIPDARREWERRKARHAEDPSIWSDPGEFEPPTRNDVWLYSKRVLKAVVEKLYTSGRKGAPEITVETLPDGTKEYRWEVRRHWLGESLIRARVSWTSSHPCTDCQGTGRGIGPSRSRWAAVMSCQTCSGQGGTTKSHNRWAYYLSGFDHEEARPLYFFAELPRGAKPTTVAEAYEALKPDPVKVAEQMNRPIFRQGDIFGIPLETMDRKALKALGARVVRRNMNIDSPPDRPIELPYVLNTNHTATEVAYLSDGVTLARGTMYHDPQGRRADHARRRIGDGKAWHVVVKNTVPIATRR